VITDKGRDPVFQDIVQVGQLILDQGVEPPLYANVRPTKILPGITSPLRHAGIGDLDWVIVRENSEGECAGCGGRVHRGLPKEVGTEAAIFTRV